MEFRMPFFFLLFLCFMLCALVSPLIVGAIIWAHYVKRWRDTGRRAGKGGSIVAVIFILAYFGVRALLGQDAPVRATSIAAAGGAGFTAGVLGTCAWVWMRVRKGQVLAGEDLL
jgi:uncharacterized membrane protein YhaH (DUF805 family)